MLPQETNKRINLPKIRPLMSIYDPLESAKPHTLNIIAKLQ
uniref:Uncharacterized protein n=1 Tax=Rhizophora mucronata TaxID=61149 RepID=A0A2P2MZJ3_RHIMU